MVLRGHGKALTCVQFTVTAPFLEGFMKQYLVESTLGMFYITSNDPSIITERCDKCGEGDSILAFWETLNNGERLEELTSYLKLGQIDSEEELVSKLNMYSIASNSINECAMLLLDSINKEYLNKITILKELFDNNSINQDEYNKLLSSTKKSARKLISYVHNYDYSKIRYDYIHKKVSSRKRNSR